MTTQLKKDQREKMFLAWVACENVHEVCIACSVSRGTATKYRKLDEWDKKLDRMKRRSFDKIELELGDVLTKQIRALVTMSSAGLRSWMDKIKTRDGKLDCSISELLNLIRCQNAMAPSPDQPQAPEDDVSEVTDEIKAGLDLLKDTSGEFVKHIARSLARRGTPKDITATEPKPRKRQRGKRADSRSKRNKGRTKNSH
jgi:hypothetical protein